MMSLDDVRALLGAEAEGKSDDELERIRASAYVWADTVTELYRRQREAAVRESVRQQGRTADVS